MNLEIAFSKVDITPDKPLELSGFIGRGNKTYIGIRDRIYCRTLMLRQDETIALVSCDVLGIPLGISERINEHARHLGIDSVVIAATHTHYAPAIIPMRMAGRVNKEYLDLFENKVSEGIEEAMNKLVNTAGVTITVGKTKDLCVNRVLRKPSGNDVIMIMFNGGLKSAIINFNCHPITLGPYYQYISSDYISYIYKYFKNKGVEALFINGAAGDVNPNVYGEDGITKIGEGVIRALDAGETMTITPQLKVYTNEVTLMMKREHLVTMKYIYYELLSRVVKKPWVLAMRDWSRDAINAIKSGEVTYEKRISITGVRTSREVAMVTCPCELSSMLGEVVKMRSAFRYTLIAGYANGYVGYIVDPALAGRAHYELKESYRFHDILPLSNDSMNKVVNAMIEALNGLTQ